MVCQNIKIQLKGQRVKGGSSVIQNVRSHLQVISHIAKKKQVVLLFTVERISKLNVLQIHAERCY